MDGIAYQIFIPAMSFFLRRKKQGLKKEALILSPYNYCVLCMIYFFLVLRFWGTIFTFSNAVISLTDFYHDDLYTIFRVINGDLVFPIRDFLEILAFSYLFYF